jgi:glycerol uptake facilitator protein
VEQRGASAYLAEFIGTLLLVFSIGAVASVNSAGVLNYTDWAAIGLVHAFTLIALIATLGRFSGGHFNPAVTIGVLVSKKITPSTAGIYIVIQLIAAVVGAAILALAFKTDVETISNLGAPAVRPEVATGKDGIWGGAIFEFIGVFVLVSTVIGTAIAPGGDRRFAPIAIGFALGAMVFLSGPVTGGSFNPARAFGPALVANSFGPLGVWIVVYVVGPVLAALAAAGVYRGLLGDSNVAAETSPKEVFSEEV